jgi:hypothetical protein
VLEQLLGAIPEDDIVLVTLGARRWGRRTTLPILVPRFPFTRLEAAVAPLLTAASSALSAMVLPRVFPKVRRILATVDPMIGIASAWARATGAELWVYTIDLHCNRFWNTAGWMQHTLLEWRRDAFAAAARGFALTPRLSSWMRENGFSAPIDLLPPLYPRWEPRPVPEGPPTLMYCGWVNSYTAGPLRWIQQAAAESNRPCRLVLVSPSPGEEISRLGVGLGESQWQLRSARPEEVPALVSQATWTIIALDPEYRDREALQVAWPTKLREYLSVGRPVLCVAASDYAVTEMLTDTGWALVAHDAQTTRHAVDLAISESRDRVQARADEAHAFGLKTMDDRLVGERWRQSFLQA